MTTSQTSSRPLAAPTVTPEGGRVQLALNVENLDEAVVFYSALFGTDPAKIKPGYANFSLDAPALKLVLIESPATAAPSTTSALRSATATPSTLRSPA